MRNEWLVTEKGGERVKEMYREHSLGAQQGAKPVVPAAVILSNFKKEREGPELTHEGVRSNPTFICLYHLPPTTSRVCSHF